MTGLRPFLPLLACAALAGAVPAAEPEKAPDPLGRALDRIEAQVGSVRSLKASFVQEKSLKAFRNTITITGTICLEKPGRVAWHVSSPLRYSVVITDEVIRQWDEETRAVHEVRISDFPVLRTVLDQMSAWFTGSYGALLGEYEATMAQERPVILEFRPREGHPAGGVIRSVTVGMREDERYLEWIRIVEKSGDSTRIRFENTVINPKLERSDFEVGRRD